MASQMVPGGAAELGKSALGGSKTVLGSSWFGSFFVLWFRFAFLSLLGSSWGRFGVLLVPFSAFLELIFAFVGAALVFFE